MNKHRAKIIGIVVGIVLAFAVGVGLWLMLPCLLACLSGLGFGDAASIGIIGGADGPTSVLISSKVSLRYIAWIVAQVAVLAAALIYRQRNSKKNKDGEQ